MKLVYISNSLIPSRFANSIHVMKMCQAIAENGHELVLLIPNLKHKHEKDINDVYEFYGVKKNFQIKKLWHPNFIGGNTFYLIAIFIYLFFNNKFDLVYGRFLHGCYVASILNFNVIYEVHEIIFKKKKSHKNIIFKKLIKAKFFKKLIVISQSLKNIYLDKKYIDESKIQVAHDGADEVKNLNLKIELLGPRDNLKVGYVGHLYKGRGIEIIIECAKKISDMTFHIVGGLKEDIDYWKYYVKKRNLKNIYFYGFVSPKETLKYRNTFDILLAPYAKKVTLEGQISTLGGISDTSQFMSPIKIFEYMSHKKPIIASNLPVLREILNPENSILVEPDHINGWVNAICSLRLKKNREFIATNAYRDFKKYSWKNRAFQIVGKFV